MYNWGNNKITRNILAATFISNKNLKNIILDSPGIEISAAKILKINNSSCTIFLRLGIDKYGKHCTLHQLPVALFLHPSVKIIQYNTGNDVTEL